MTLRNTLYVSASLLLMAASAPAYAAAANPFAAASTLPYHAPRFDQIKDSDYKPAFEQGMKEQIAEMKAIKTHNPFAVNDLYFATQTGCDLKNMNNYGCSLIWGHPQGPTGLRAIVELIEELAIRGGGLGLFQGCAAGDSSMAVVIEVSGR